MLPVGPELPGLADARVAVDRHEVAIGPTRHRRKTAALVEVVGVVDVDEIAVLGDVPDAGRFVEEVVVGLHLLVADRETGVDAVLLAGEPRLRPVLDREARIDDLRVVVRRHRLATDVAEERVVHELPVAAGLHRLHELGVVADALGVIARTQEAQTAIQTHLGSELHLVDGRESGGHELGILRIRGQARGVVVVDAGLVEPVVDEVHRGPVDTEVLGVVGPEELVVEVEGVVVVGDPGDGPVTGLHPAESIVVVAARLLSGVAQAIGQVVLDRTAHIGRPAALVVHAIGADHLAMEPVEVGLLGLQVDVAADVLGGSIDHRGGALDDVDRLHGVEVDRQTVAVAGQARAHAVDEGVGDLTADVGGGGGAEIGPGVGAGGQLGEITDIEDVDRVELLPGDDGHIPRGIDHAAIGAVDGVHRAHGRHHGFLQWHRLDQGLVEDVGRSLGLGGFPGADRQGGGGGNRETMGVHFVQVVVFQPAPPGLVGGSGRLLAF